MAPSAGCKKWKDKFVYSVFTVLISLQMTEGFFLPEYSLSVPHDADTGFTVTSILCSKEEIQISHNSSNVRDVIPDLFNIGNEGQLMTSTQFHDFIDHIFSIEPKTSNCKTVSSFSLTKSLTIHIVDAKQVLSFPQSLYEGYISKNVPPNSIVSGIKNLHVVYPNDKTDDISYKLVGDESERFKLVRSNAGADDSLSVVTLSPLVDLPPSTLYLTILAENFVGLRGHTNLWVHVHDPSVNLDPTPIAHPKIYNNSSASKKSSTNSIPLKTNMEFLPLGTQGNRHHRLKRAVDPDLVVLEVKQLNETATGVLFSVSQGPPDANMKYRILNSTMPTTFVVDPNNGQVSLASGSKLDYDVPESRTGTLFVEYYNVSNYEEVEKLIQVSIEVEEENDEDPVFTNQPFPFLATISRTQAPGSTVYTLTAEDVDQGSNIQFSLASDSSNRFRMTQGSGNTAVITTNGSASFQEFPDYLVKVIAVDTAASPEQSATATVSIKAGERPPQFYKQSYQASLQERNGVGKPVPNLRVEVKSFQNRPVTLSIEGTYSNIFSVNNAGEVTVRALMDYETEPRQYVMMLKATETAQLTSTVSLTVNIIDKNEFEPEFNLKTYRADAVKEDADIGTSIITVTATDGDYGTVLTFEVLDDRFRMENKPGSNTEAVMYVRKPLDYDRNINVLKRYELTVLAIDNGQIRQTGDAVVNVYVIDVNDNAPVFTGDLERSTAKDRAVGGAEVMQVQASDADYGDRVTYAFKAPSPYFDIDSTTGRVTVKQSVTLPADQYIFVLPVVATDDGGCCPDSTDVNSAETDITIKIFTDNLYPPEFENCASYTPSINEMSSVGDHVINVTAVDRDFGENGEVTYEAVRRTENEVLSFSVDSQTGEIKVAQEIDRESLGSSKITFTVRAQDKGGLNTLCPIKITINDINDNPPVFSFASYNQNLWKDAANNTLLVQVQATDADKDLVNREIIYSFDANGNPGEYFRIDPNNGEIRLKKLGIPLEARTLRVRATDTGNPPLNGTAEVRITVTETSDIAPPEWLANNTAIVTVEENYSKQGPAIANFTAMSKYENPGLSFVILKDGKAVSTSDPFYVLPLQGSNSVVQLKIIGDLDYEKQKEYKVILRATDQRPGQSLSKDYVVTVNVLDQNDNIPEFLGRDLTNGYILAEVNEEEGVGTSFRTLQAEDYDLTSPNNQIDEYLIEPGDFTLDSRTGVMRTGKVFDREDTNTCPNPDGECAFFIKVNVSDNGTPKQNSGPVTVKITIKDINDQQPYFPQTNYTFQVPESADIEQVVGSVTAQDADYDAKFTYSITGADATLPFDIRTRNPREKLYEGQIYVSKGLDYEDKTKPNPYVFTVQVDDGKFTATTTITIHIEDVNDNAPVVSDYSNDNITEEQCSNPCRQLLTRIQVTDADEDRNNNFKFILRATSNDAQFFEVDESTGDLYLTQKLDRDSGTGGRPVYQFNIEVQDEPDSNFYQVGSGLVTIRPIDINDNSPFFEPATLVQEVPEHSQSGTNVGPASATDYDEGINAEVLYRLVSIDCGSCSPKPAADAFLIDTDTGMVTTNMAPNLLDRETISQYFLVLTAVDKGPAPGPHTGTGTLTINVGDINDHGAVFDQTVYNVTMSEHQTSSYILQISASDEDIGVNRRMNYDILSQPPGQHFRMQTIVSQNIGSLNVVKPVDYDRGDHFFTVIATAVNTEPPAGGGVAVTATATIYITVEDYNDEIPQFVESTISVDLKEDVPKQTSVANFTATDKDTGVNGEFDYHIELASDPNRLFTIDTTGVVRVQNALDREAIPPADQDKLTIYILAIDRGRPQQTGTATLTVSVIDVNDEPPVFAEDYRPFVVEERVYNGDFLLHKLDQILEIKAVDPDRNDKHNGFPFNFALQCSSSVTPLQCGKFTLKEDTAGDDHRGSAKIRVNGEFDREQVKFIYLPIVLTDQRNYTGTAENPLNRQTGTSTLTVEVRDVNDNPHKGGYKTVSVFNYKGQYQNTEIGTVYAEDPDDWDTDKSYELLNTVVSEKYVSVDRTTGMITLKKVDFDHDFTIKVKVSSNFDVPNHGLVTATSTVKIIVTILEEDAVHNSGSVRIEGITAEEFITKAQENGQDVSMYDKFENLLAEKLPTEKKNVFVLGVYQTMGESYTDVRFAAHGSPWYQPGRMNGVVNNNEGQFNNILDGTIDMVPIDMCRFETCEAGCFNNLIIDETNPALVNSNTTSFVGVKTEVRGECGCRAREFTTDATECPQGYCYHGGVCQKDYFGIISCNCSGLDPKYDGPRCQQTRHSFNGTGYAMYEPLEQCLDSRTSIEILYNKSQDSALIFYNGPMKDLNPSDPQDYILLELNNGYPRLRVNHGTGELSLSINGLDSSGAKRLNPLTDNTWHRVDIIRSGKEVTMIVDHCTSAVGDGPDRDTAPCEKRGVTPGENRFINVDSPLQVGGVRNIPNYPTGITSSKFSGCIKNLIHNSQVYDLSTGDTFPGTKDGCDYETNLCSADCDHGHCQVVSPNQGECLCDSGYRTSDTGICSVVTTIQDLRTNSYLDWRFKDAFFSSLKTSFTELQISYRSPRNQDGLLFAAFDRTNDNKYFMLEIENNHLQVRYDLWSDTGAAPHVLELSHVPASDGQWHDITVKRYGTDFILMMDDGEGRKYNDTLIFSNDIIHAGLDLRQDRMHAGASLGYETGSITFRGQDLQSSCLTDIRLNAVKQGLNNRLFAMTPAENNDPKFSASLVNEENTAVSECSRDPCAGITCPDPNHVCVNLWDRHLCKCKDGYVGVGSCQPVNYCESHQCVGGATCVLCTSTDCTDAERLNGYNCVCSGGWSGLFCQCHPDLISTSEGCQGREEDPGDPGVAVAGIVVGAIIALIAIIILIVVAICLVKRKNRPEKAELLDYDPDDDIRENIMEDDVEGAGEEDQTGYDLSRLRKPDSGDGPWDAPDIPRGFSKPVGKGLPSDRPDIGDFIGGRLGDADDDPNSPPFDTLRDFGYEGGDSEAGSLSSLNTSSSGSQDYDYLNDWGPKFAKLADMYNKYDESE